LNPTTTPQAATGPTPKSKCIDAYQYLRSEYRCLGNRENLFFGLASIFDFFAIPKTEIGGKSILEGKTTILSYLVDLPVLPAYTVQETRYDSCLRATMPRRPAALSNGRQRSHVTFLFFIAICNLNVYANEKSAKPCSFLNLPPLVRGGQQEVTASGDNFISSTPSPYEYTPVTALNDYGQSLQLRNAMESAVRFGTPVLACLCTNADVAYEDNAGSSLEPSTQRENAIIICSLQKPRFGIIAPTYETDIITSKRPGGIHSSIGGMVRILANRDDSTVHKENDIPRHSLHIALITTGIASDANFLLGQLQKHFMKKYWFRYDALPDGGGAMANGEGSGGSYGVVVRKIREIILDFLGYDWSEEIGSSALTGGIGSAAPSYTEDDEDGSARAGRPLGVCSFVLGLDGVPSLTVIQANGSAESYVAHAMGVGSELGNKRLSQRWKRGMSLEEAKNMMRDTLKEIAVERGWLPDDKLKASQKDIGETSASNLDTDIEGTRVCSELTMVCETVTSRGIEIEYYNLS
jgi:20S proteasome alpha/beta subunit